MTSPIEEIEIKCPNCGMMYSSWYRPSINLNLDDFDEEYIDECSSAVCPCKFKVYFETIVVDKEGWHFDE